MVHINMIKPQWWYDRMAHHFCHKEVNVLPYKNQAVHMIQGNKCMKNSHKPLKHLMADLQAHPVFLAVSMNPSLSHWQIGGLA